MSFAKNKKVNYIIIVTFKHKTNNIYYTLTIFERTLTLDVIEVLTLEKRGVSEAFTFTYILRRFNTFVCLYFPNLYQIIITEFSL